MPASADEQRLRLALRLISPLLQRVHTLAPELARLAPEDVILFRADVMAGLEDLVAETFPDDIAWQAEAVGGAEIERLADLMASLLNAHRLAQARMY